MPVDFRLVAATNRDLREMMRHGKFRDDLYYRLSTMSVEIPSLNKRTGDIDLLVKHFLSVLDRSETQVSPEARKVLNTYNWPGNVRQLRNVIERAVSLAEKGVIEPEHLPAEIDQDCIDSDRLYGFSDTSLADEMARFEKALLERALSMNNGVMSKTAKKLNISRSTLYEKCRKHGVMSHSPKS